MLTSYTKFKLVSRRLIIYKEQSKKEKKLQHNYEQEVRRVSRRWFIISLLYITHSHHEIVLYVLYYTLISVNSIMRCIPFYLNVLFIMVRQNLMFHYLRVNNYFSFQFITVLLNVTPFNILFIIDISIEQIAIFLPKYKSAKFLPQYFGLYVLKNLCSKLI